MIVNVISRMSSIVSAVDRLVYRGGGVDFKGFDLVFGSLQTNIQCILAASEDDFGEFINNKLEIVVLCKN